MKKIILTVAAFGLAAFSALAQVTLGAGYTGMKSDFSNMEGKWYHGFNLGVGYNLPLGLGFEFCPSIEYNYLTRLEETAAGNGETAGENRFNEHYLSIPLLFDYGYEINRNARIFIFAGPAASFRLYADPSESGDNGPKRWDVRLGAGVGMDIYRHWRIQAGYDYGLLDRSKSEGTKLHFHNVRAGITYLF